MIQKPYLIELNKIGSISSGFISVAEGNTLIPFIPKRVYWIYETPENKKRGTHYHHQLEQIIVCLNGEINITLENKKGEKYKYTLDHPSKALYVPSEHWRELIFKNNAILLCVASELYNEKDYVRDYKEFKKLMM